MLRSLAGLSSLPWVIMGDFSDLLHHYEKRDLVPHSDWLITGFRNAVADSGLQDFPFTGPQFTWERFRGTADMVEEKLDRILTSDSWTSLFDGATACSFITPYSDHIPLLLIPVMVTQECRRCRFCFDNVWLREDKCREIIAQSWDRTVGMDVLRRIEACSYDV
ncbi:PREDICTED: uncharacterized protein LOC109184976 [Ipomoea nil]|uniref:uncharacterized protein LOC109184976 n=1 Tax=Ipomoea nil TaxID=35883 RepID=UPI00090192CA|nr:PREDICTED: uncharacterized protein LOC109184976 [Ipomoea nil]